MRMRLLSIACLAGLAFGQQASAGTILYFNDLSVGTDRMGQALALLGGTHTVTTATSPADFAAKIATGNFQLGIFFQQFDSGAGYDAAFAALATHIGKGGLAIADDWTMKNAHAAAFGAGFTGGGNQNQFTVTDPQLAAGIVNPVNLVNPGWGIFSTDLTNPLGTVGATFPNATAAIVIGNDRRTIFNGFLSDTFADGPEGVQLFVNQVNSVFAAIPEPTTVATLAMMAFGAAGIYRRRRAA